jgi:hypothetical protein
MDPQPIHPAGRHGRLLPAGWRPVLSLPVGLTLLGVMPALIGTVPAATETQDPVTYQVTRATSEINLDGTLDEPAWDTALSIDLAWEVRPGDNIPPPVKTVVLVTYNDRFVYFGFRADDPDPSKIRARYSDRDQAWNDDWVGIVLDTFNDQRRAYEMMSNPLGVQIDALNDDVGGNYDTSWNAIWESAGTITEAGFEVEIAVPYNQIRFQKTKGNQTWGFDAIRSYPRNDRHHIGAFPRDRGNNSYLSQTVKITGMEGADPGKNLEVIPTLTGSRSDNREELPDGEMINGDPEGEVGVSLRWGMTPNMSLNGAYNPDFSQVEADVLQLNVNETFALFFPETRPFFMEGSDYFNTEMDLVYTRNIADPEAAAKVTAKQGNNTWGVFSARDEVTNLLVPGPQGSSADSFDMDNLSSVGRYRFDFGANSTVGGTITDRRGDGYANSVVSADTVYRITTADMLTAIFAFSQTQYNEAMVESLGVQEEQLKDSAIEVEYRHTVRNWWLEAEYEDFGEDFRSDLGFRPQVDIAGLEFSGARVWWGDGSSFFNRAAWGGSLFHREQQNGDLLNEGVSTWLNFNGPLQSFGSVAGSSTRRRFSGEDFDLWDVSLDYEIQPNASVILGISSLFGPWIDFTNVQEARQLRLRPFIQYRAGRHVNLRYTHIYSQLDVQGGELFRVHAPEVRLIYQINRRAFVRLIAQYQNLRRDPSLYTTEVVDARDDSLLTQFLFTYKVNPQTAIYAGYSDNQIANDSFDLTRTGRTIFIKLSYAWVR